MLQGLIVKKIIDVVIKRIMEKSALRNMRKYVEEDNELDIKVKAIEKIIKKLAKNSHPSQEFICCRECGCKIAKTKKRRK
jgi:hypothetical protein